MSRSNSLAVRNPITQLPAFAGIQALGPNEKAALMALLYELGAAARIRGEQQWRKNKPPMAAYWKAVGVNARHIARAIKSDLKSAKGAK